MELKPNMYYRTYSGFINKIISIKDYNEREYLLNGFYINKKDTIKKASYNIIDILEVGDYVNGYSVTAILSSNNKVYEIQVKRPNNRTGVWIERIRNNEDIKSIVTKEQFENMAYKVGE